MNRRWLILALIFFGIVISYIDRGNLSIAAPSIMHDLRIDPGKMGILLSAFFWTYATFQIPAGIAVDRFGIRRAYAAGFLIWSLASASIAISRGTSDIIGMRMVLGMAESIGPLASITFIRRHFAGKDAGLPMAIYIAGQSIGPALGARVGTQLLDHFGWRSMFAITGLGALIFLPCWLLAVPSDGTRASRQVNLETPGHLPWKTLFTGHGFVLLALTIFLSSYYWYFILTWVPSYLVLSRGYSNLEMGRIMSTGLFIMAGIIVIVGYAADRLSARIGILRARTLVAASGYFAAASVLLLLIAPSRSWVFPVLAVSMCATGIGNSNFWAIAQHVPPPNMTGRAVGYLNTISQIAGAAAPVITGWILGPKMHFGPAILTAGVCPVLAAACLLRRGKGPEGPGVY